jgi:hypothetical protein
MKLRDLSSWDEALQRVSGVHAQEADVGKSESRRSAKNAVDTTGQALNAKIIVLWVRCRQADEERTVAATQIDYWWRGTNEDLCEIQRLRDRCRHKFDRGFILAKCVASPH